MKFSYPAVLVSTSAVVGQTIYHSELNINKCLDNSGARVVPGNPIQINDCNNNIAQEWVPISAPAIHLSPDQSFCIDGGNNTQPGSPVVINPCNSTSSSQRFSPTLFSGLIELITTGLCIGVPGNITTNRNRLQLELCNVNDTGQVWNPAPAFNK